MPKPLPRRMRSLRLLLALALVGVLIGSARHSRADHSPPIGPGLGNLTYSSDEVFKPISVVKTEGGGHGFIAMHKGWMVVLFAPDSGRRGGGFAFYDVSNPREPRQVSVKYDAETVPIREPHGFGFSSSYDGDYVVLQTIDGIQFWDWTDIFHPQLLSHLVLPEIQESDYALGNWWTFWQAPYVYVGGTGNGLYVVDASDPRNPVLVNRLLTSQTGGFRVGPVFAVGNLLVATSQDQRGYATFDISDPAEPVLLASQISDLPIPYSTMVNGDKIFAADDELVVHDISDPTQFRLVNRSPDMGGKGGYLTIQDGFAHVGASSNYAKVDYRDDLSYKVVGRGTSGIADRDEDFATVLGNLALVGDDHAVGSAIIPHQAEPDTSGPVVTMVNPKPQALNQALTSRIGFTFSDQIDLSSVNIDTVKVRPLHGEPLAGKYSGQTGIINFAPDQPLQPDTTYEIVVPAGGVKDYAGNPTTETFTARFSTGPDIVLPLSCSVQPMTPIVTGGTSAVSAAASQEPAEYSFDFGDGSPPTPFSSSNTASHTYNTAGHYSVLVRVRTASEESSCSGIQTVHHPLSEVRPTASSTIIHDDSTDQVWVVNPDTDTVTAIAADSNSKLFEVAVGNHPRTLARAPDGTIWVVNQGDSTHRRDAFYQTTGDAAISVLDGKTGAMIQRIPLPYASRPFGIAFSPDGSAAYVTLQGTGKLLQLDPDTRKVVQALDVGPTPRGIAISSDSRRILVSRFISPQDHGEVIEVDATTFSRVRAFTLAVDPGPDAEDNSRGVPNYLTSLRISPDGKRAWIPSKKDNVQRGTYNDGQPLTFETTVRAIVSQINLETNQEDLAARRDLDDRSLPQAVAFSKYGDYAFVATLGTNTVEVLDAYNGHLITGLPQVGRSPQGLVFNADYTRLYIDNFMSRSVSVYDVSGFIDSSDTTARLLAEVRTIREEKLAPEVFEGKQIFYNADDQRMNRDKYIACASCHLDGESDGRVWDFTQRGEGLRKTISLLGRAGMGHGNVHWTGNFDEIQDFENDIRHEFAGEGFMSDEKFYDGTREDPLGDAKAGASRELDALASFVSSLDRVNPSPFRKPDGKLTGRAKAGKKLFHELGCVTCHGGTDFTDSDTGALHDVGTLSEGSGSRRGEPLTGLDTPTLKGLWETAPYLHDGSAATLMDVLTTANPRGKHGDFSQLSQEHLEKLVEYMLQIDERETPYVTIDYVSSDKDYTLTPAVAGAQVYIDKPVTIGELSPALDRAILIRTANSDKNLTTDQHLQFTLLAPSRVYVAFDPGATALPAWLDESWTRTDEKFVTSDQNASPMTVYSKTFPAGQVTLGGNMQAPASGVQAHYVVLIGPNPPFSAIVDYVSTGKNYVVGPAAVGETYYIDRGYTISQLSPALAGGLVIRTANDDKRVQADTHLKVTINKPATIYVAFDKRTILPPAWLDTTWTLTSEVFAVTDSGASPMRVYKKHFPAGQFALGGNMQPPAYGMRSHYAVVLRPDEQ